MPGNLLKSHDIFRIEPHLLSPTKPPRYLFIGGLHRSGTSLVNRLAIGLPGAGGITDAPVPENEGVYLQGAIPHTAQSGRPMHFATNPDEHMTEHHPLNRLETKLRLEHDWAPWFPPDVCWRVEKSPVNLTRMRLLQQLFPTSQFIVMMRHPEAVVASTAAWVDAPLTDLHRHWVEAYERVTEDLPHLHAVLVLRYEDVVAESDRALRQIAAFLNRPAVVAGEEIVDGNPAYAGTECLKEDIAKRVARWGYASRLTVQPRPVEVRHPLRAVREAVEAA